jgi:hypothetical protein
MTAAQPRMKAVKISDRETPGHPCSVKDVK